MKTQEGDNLIGFVLLLTTCTIIPVICFYVNPLIDNRKQLWYIRQIEKGYFNLESDTDSDDDV